MSVPVVFSIAFDAVATPFGRRERMLVEELGTERAARLTPAEVHERVGEIHALTQFGLQPAQLSDLR